MTRHRCHSWPYNLGFRQNLDGTPATHGPASEAIDRREWLLGRANGRHHRIPLPSGSTSHDTCVTVSQEVQSHAVTRGPVSSCGFSLGRGLV